MRVEDAFRRNLNKEMVRQDIRPRTLAKRAGVSLTAVYEAKRGNCMPSTVTVWKLANGLGVLVDDLLKGATE